MSDPIPANTSTEAGKAPAPIITDAAPEPLIKVEKTPEDALKTPETAAPATPEVKYEFKAPEGFDVKELEAFAREHKLPPAAAQKVLEREVAAQQKVVVRQEAEFKELTEKIWPAEIYNDKELGGANIDKTRASVMKAWNEVPKAVRDEITKVGFHTNPLLVKLLNHFGQMTKEDRIAGPNNPAPPSKSRPSLEAQFAEIHKSNQ